MPKYTFTMDHTEQGQFRSILSRLDPAEYVTISDLVATKPEERTSDMETIMEMDSECALTFRMGMKYIKIKRERTEEEVAEEAALKAEYDERNLITINVKVPPVDAPEA